jgi:hypothetical protein
VVARWRDFLIQPVAGKFVWFGSARKMQPIGRGAVIVDFVHGRIFNTDASPMKRPNARYCRVGSPCERGPHFALCSTRRRPSKICWDALRPDPYPRPRKAVRSPPWGAAERSTPCFTALTAEPRPVASASMDMSRERLAGFLTDENRAMQEMTYPGSRGARRGSGGF